VTCPHCQSAFEATDYRRRYCSRECSREGCRARQLAQRKTTTWREQNRLYTRAYRISRGIVQSPGIGACSMCGSRDHIYPACPLNADSGRGA
jgi:hypothetical protein